MDHLQDIEASGTERINSSIWKKIFHLFAFILVSIYYIYTNWFCAIDDNKKNIILFIYVIMIIYMINKYSLYKRTLFKVFDWIVDVFQETIYRDIAIGIISTCQLIFIIYLCYLNIVRVYAFLTAIGLIIISILLNLRKLNILPWNVIIRSLNVQFILAIMLFYFPFGKKLMIEMGRGIITYLRFSEIGARFVYGNMLIDHFIFAFYIMSSIYISFITITILRHYGFIGFLKELSLKLTFIIGITPIEGVIGLVNTCLSMTETCVVVRNNLIMMTQSELFSLMVSGLSTISFTALFGYVSLGANIDYLLTSIIISIPCSFAFVKIFYPPQTVTTSRYDQRHLTYKMEEICPEIPTDNKNIIDHCTESIMEANYVIQLIIGNLIFTVSFVAFLDRLIEILCCPFIENFGLIKILTLGLSYLMPAIGVSMKDSYMLAEMFIKKMLIDEFVAFQILGKTFKEIASERAIIVANFLLCGAGNVSSIGMLPAIINSLTKNKVNVTHLAIKSLYVSCFVNIYCACTISILI